jgi:hypothetical protein
MFPEMPALRFRRTARLTRAPHVPHSPSPEANKIGGNKMRITTALIVGALSLTLAGCFEGPKGDTGPAGSAGKDGVAGPAGPAGKDGTPGKDGAAGKDGATGSVNLRVVKGNGALACGAGEQMIALTCQGQTGTITDANGQCASDAAGTAVCMKP